MAVFFYSVLFVDQHSTFSVQADFTEEVLRGRFIEEHFTPAMLTSNHWQVFMLLSCYLKIRTILHFHVKFLLQLVASIGISIYFLTRHYEYVLSAVGNLILCCGLFSVAPSRLLSLVLVTSTMRFMMLTRELHPEGCRGIC